MKKILLFSFVLFLSIMQSMAQKGNYGHLTIISEDGEPFTLYLNNERYNKIPAVAVRVEEVRNNSYDVRIQFKNRRFADVNVRNVSVADEEGYMQDISYSVSTMRRGTRALSLYSVIPMSPIYINVDDMEIVNWGRPGARKSYDSDFKRRWEDSRYTYRGGRGPGRDYYPDDRDRDHYHEHDHEHDNVINVPTLSPADFSAALSMIQNESFESNKLSTAKTIISSNFLTTDQIIAIINLFSFESSKLDFAKAAYRACLDPQNYFKVSNAFSFSSSKKELNDYIIKNPIK